MKTFVLFISVAFSALCWGTAYGGTVTLTSAGGRQFRHKDGSMLPAGALIRVGTFNLPPATRDQTLRSTSDYGQLAAWFKPLGESVAGAGAIAQTNGSPGQLCSNDYPSQGHVFGTIANITSSYMSPGTKLYVWVFDAENPRDSSQWGIFTATDWVVPPALGAMALSTKVTVEAIQGETTADQVRLGTPAPTFGNWTMKHFPANASGSTIAFNADPDGDGIHNLAEYAWQLNPNTRDDMRTTLQGVTTGGATFTFKSPRNLSDVAVTAECSPDLVTWSPATSTVTATDADFDTHTCTAAPGAGRCFWRVRFAAVTP